jgi:putative hydrolase of the HAD superfamily
MRMLLGCTLYLRRNLTESGYAKLTAALTLKIRRGQFLRPGKSWHKAAMETPPPKPDFGHVTTWVFDLDNTLYPHHSNLFSQIDVKMTSYVAQLLGLPRDEARMIQKQFYLQYGTTLKGLMQEHSVDHRDFLAKVHDIDYSWLEPNPALGLALRALPGRKFIFTNGDRGHAERAAGQLGVLDEFDDIFDIVAADLTPKPARETYDRFLRHHAVSGPQAAMFEDLARNLVEAKAVGMATVLILPGDFQGDFVEAWEKEGHDGGHVDYTTDDLTGFLKAVLT